ncbi:hypothetical protein [Actinoplanes sp. NPDC049802]|uniref:hypothetical protein n=1 Tax=Actinoplanes sp. NPDC049802 TaxID=3154742 RepID=UPI0033CA09A4
MRGGDPAGTAVSDTSRRRFPGLAAHPRIHPWPPALKPISTSGWPEARTRNPICELRAVGRHPPLRAPAHRSGNPLDRPCPALDQDRRWADTRRLLHDDTYPTADRVAGLLVLLYAQMLNVICALTTQHLSHVGGQTLLALGSRPIVLPAPLDRLVNELADATRQPSGGSLINTPSSWLFPGRWPGRPLTEGALARRLHVHSLQPRQGRNIALFMLAAEVPATILAKMLGIHIKAAIQMQRLSNGDWATYAAEVSQRNHHG